MKFLHSKVLFNSTNRTQLENASNALFKKIQNLNSQELQLSDYGVNYFKTHINSLQYLFQMYTFMLDTLQKKVQKPFSEILLIDHGAGIGILSLLCATLKIKVIHNDVYRVICNDAKQLSLALELPFLDYHHGNTIDLVQFCKSKSYNVDAIISSEVIEHIYDIDQFFFQLKALNKNLHFVFGTSANEKNYFRRKKLMNQQYIAEHIGFKDFEGRKQKDTITAFLKVRAQLIRESFPKLPDSEVELLAKRTRGKQKKAILNSVFEYTFSGNLPQKITHATNTCDPLTGNWTEHLMNPYDLQKKLTNLGFKTQIKAGFYGSENDFFVSRTLKMILNFIIKISGKLGLKIAHYWMLIA